VVQIPGVRVGDMPTNQPVPEGIYHLRVDKAELKKTSAGSKNPGSPMAEVTFTIFGPEEAEEFHGRKVFENLMLVGDGMFRLRQLLEADGQGEDFVLEDTEQLLKIECMAVVQIEPEREQDGKKYNARNKVAKFMPMPSA
jgi:hypothetical protein